MINAPRCSVLHRIEIYTNFIESFVEALYANWTSPLPSSKVNDATLPLLSDMLNATCTYLNLYDNDIFLRGLLSIGYNKMLVRMIMTTPTLVFGPGPGQATCHPMVSSLLTHVRSDCNQTFCAVPTTCTYLGHEAIIAQSDLWQYDFICICGQSLCNELLLWLRSGQFNRVGLCELGFRLYWLVC